MSKVKKYIEKNVGQCWYCKNRIGSQELLVRGELVELPECKVTEEYMTFVNRPHCPEFEYAHCGARMDGKENEK